MPTGRSDTATAGKRFPLSPRGMRRPSEIMAREIVLGGVREHGRPVWRSMPSTEHIEQGEHLRSAPGDGKGQANKSNTASKVLFQRTEEREGIPCVVASPCPCLENATTGKIPTWNVSEESIRQVPHFYPLEKSSVTVEDVVAADLAARVANFFRLCSIEAKFDDGNASAHARSWTNVVFGLQLWRPKNAKKRAITIEAQRLGGCVVEFRTICSALFQAAASPTGAFPKPIAPPNPACPGSEPLSKEPNRTPGQGLDSSRQELLDSISSALILLASPKQNENQLGLESICILTDPNRVCKDFAVLLCRTIFLGEGPSGRKLRELILSNIGRPNTHHSPDEMGISGAAHQSMMQDLALEAITNVLSFAASFHNEAAWSSTEFVENSLEWWSLLAALAHLIEEATEKPREAALAAACFRCILLTQPGDRRKSACALAVLPALVSAYEYGKARHSFLEAESCKLLSVLTTADQQCERVQEEAGHAGIGVL